MNETQMDFLQENTTLICISKIVVKFFSAKDFYIWGDFFIFVLASVTWKLCILIFRFFF